MLRSHGVGWGGDVNVPSTTFPRPCTRCWCYAHIGWGGVKWGMFTFLRPRSLDLAQDADATLTLGGEVWGGDVNVPSATFLRPRSLDLAQDADATLTWGGVGWGCLRSFDHVPSTLHKMLMLCYAHMGWGWVGWGGDVYVPSTTFPRPCTGCWCYAHIG